MAGTTSGTASGTADRSEAAAPSGPAALPPRRGGSGDGDGEEGQRRALARARREATALLVVVAVAFLVAIRLPDTTATGYLVAALEAGLVGGLADWFAVVALFRHPLGVPIPHTAVIPRSKDGLGRNLAAFVERNFLDEGQVREQVADPVNVERLAGMLADRERADRIVARAARVLDAVLDAVDDDEVAVAAAARLREQLAEAPIARLAGQSVEAAVVEGRHDALVTAVLEGVGEAIERNRAVLRQRLGDQSPGWVPPVVDDLVFERGEQVVRTFLEQVASDPEHELRRSLDEQLLAVTARLRTDEELQGRVADVVQEVVSDELLVRWMADWWADARRLVRDAAVRGSRGRALRRAAVDRVVAFGEHLRDDPAMRERAVEMLEQAAEPVTTIAQREVGGLIEATVDRWDAEDTSRRLELWLGRDLQFVRINGTIVGAAVGIVLHAVQTLV